MTRFATMFSNAAASNLVRQFGESLTYYADGAGAGRSITGMVQRDVQIISETGDVMGLAFVIRVENDVTTGISSTEVDTGADEIAVARRVGKSAERRRIVRVESTENGLTRLVVQ